MPAFGSEWYPREMYLEGSEINRHHVATYGPLTKFGYKEFVPMFKAEHFDPEAGAKLFKEAGARYVVPVFEHHDGFAMYDSGLSDWTAKKMGPHRDVGGELTTAVRAQGMHVGVSSHRIEHDWFLDGGRKQASDVNDPRYAAFYGPAHAKQLADVVSKNGNLLMNIGPMADGTIPQQVQQVLLDVGSWLKQNGDAIYGTRPWTSFGEGPTQVKAGSFHDTDTIAYTPQDFRFTTKGDALYAIELAWPAGGEAMIHALRSNLVGVRRVKSVTLLSSGTSLTFSQRADGLHIQVPAQAPGQYAYTYRVTFDAGGE